MSALPTDAPAAKITSLIGLGDKRVPAGQHDRGRLAGNISADESYAAKGFVSVYRSGTIATSGRRKFEAILGLLPRQPLGRFRMASGPCVGEPMILHTLASALLSATTGAEAGAVSTIAFVIVGAPRWLELWRRSDRPACRRRVIPLPPRMRSSG